MQPKQTPADGLPLASGLSGLLLDSSRGTLRAQREERRTPPALPPAIRPGADGNTQTAGTRGAKRQRERQTTRERERERERERNSDCCHKLGAVCAIEIERETDLETQKSQDRDLERKESI